MLKTFVRRLLLLVVTLLLVTILAFVAFSIIPGDHFIAAKEPAAFNAEVRAFFEEETL